jgi:glycosyltransferase involved in cell wall biosynthesis
MWKIVKEKDKPSKTKLLIAGHDFKFAVELIKYFEELNSFEIKIDKWNGHNSHNLRISKKLLDWADIIFCEWCLGNAVWYSKNKNKNQKLYIRLHRQEITTHFPENVNWRKVDRLIFIAPKIQEIVEDKYPECKKICMVIYNYVEYKKFNLPKISGFEFNVGLLGMLPSNKRPDIAVNIIKKLIKLDKRYKLYIKSKKPKDLNWLWERDEERIYYEKLYKTIKENNLTNNVVFEPHGKNVPEWFQKIGYILSCSDVEGSHQAVAEGMATGTIPMITGGYYKKYGALMMYPQKYMNEDIDEITNKISLLNKNEVLRSKEICFCKKFAETNFNINLILEQYYDLITNNDSPDRNSSYGINKIIESPKILIYGDINMNILDGSTVWLTNLVNMLLCEAFNEPEIHLLSKTDVQNEINLNNISKINKIIIHQPSTLHNNVKNSSFKSYDSQKAIKYLDDKFNFDSIVIRGQNIMRDFSPKDTILRKVIAYSIHNLEDMKDTVLNCQYLACQTQILKDFYLDNGIPKSKIFILPPLINSTKDEPSFKRSGFNLIYTGTLKNDYNSIQIIKCFDKLYEYNKDFHLFLVISKIYRKPQGFTNEIEELINKHKLGDHGVSIYTSLPKSEVAKMIQNADVGISWRKPSMDESKELSTKLLEYASLGKPMILNRNRINISIFGEDYPYYANSEAEYLEKLNLVFSNDTLYEKTSRKVYNVSKNYSYEHVHKLTKKYFVNFNR